MPGQLRLAPELLLPLDAITRTFGIFGQRETGKSTTGATLVEQGVRAGGRAVILDPTGVWYGLTRAGTEPGLPGVVLGGEFADAPLEPTAGALVARFVIDTTYPLVVLDMKLMRKHQRQHFAMEFLEVLYHDNRDPLLVVLDEAAQFAPTHMREGGDVPRLLGAVEDLVKLGRSRGLGAAMIEQRIATLNANVREQIGTLLAHRLVGPLDRKALKEWVAAQGEPEREAEALALISKLDPGTALVWSPAWIKFFGIVAINNATTFDSRATPKVGQRRSKPGPRAVVDLDALVVAMAESIEKQKANDPAELRKRIRELERAKPTVDNAEVTRLQEALRNADEVATQLDQELHEATEKLAAVERHEQSHKLLCTLLDELQDLHERGLSAMLALNPASNGALPPPTRPRIEISKLPRPSADAAPHRRPPVTQPGRTGGSPPERAERGADRQPARSAPAAPTVDGELPLGKGEQKVLQILAEYPEGRTHNELAFLAGYSAKASTVGVFLSKLRKAGLVEEGQPIRATAAGLEAAGGVRERPTGQALLDEWLQHPRIGAGERAVLLTLVDWYPREPTHEELCEITGYSPTASTVGVFLSKLRKLGLVEGGRRLSPAFAEAIERVYA